jgi:chromosome segregation ATPase
MKKRTSDFGSKVVTMLKKTGKALIASEEDGAPTECTFRPAPKTLDIMVQARENLNSFRTYLETDPTDSHKCYELVALTMSRAVSQFTNRTADLQEKLNEARTAVLDFTEQEQITRARKAECQERLKALHLQESEVRAEIQTLNHEAADLQAGIAAGKTLKRSMRDGKRQFDELQAELTALEAEFHREEERTKEAKRELADGQAALEKRKKDTDDELARTEKRIRELTARLKRQEIFEREAQSRAQKRRASAATSQEQKVATFVIDDRVKVSHDELEGLSYMVTTIQRENRELSEDVESKQMDIDCLMQENRGLHQLIRQSAAKVNKD